jgi:hypothetical protein
MTRSQMSGILIKAHGFIIINANSSDQKKKKKKKKKIKRKLKKYFYI